MKFSRVVFFFGSLQHATKANGENLRGDRKLDDNVFDNSPSSEATNSPISSALQEKLDKCPLEKQAEIYAKLAEMNPDIDGDYFDIDDQCNMLFEYPAPRDEFEIQDGRGTRGTNGQQYPVATSFEPSGVPIYHSKPGSKYTLYLDFDGHSWSNHAWAPDKFIDAFPYSLDADFDTYSDIELSNIGNSWAIVAEDFAPFDIDVTTEAPNVIDNDVGHVLMTEKVDKNNETMDRDCNCGGVAYLDRFGSGRDNYTYYSPALVFSKRLVGLWAISHEFGHNLGLYHDGKDENKYYAGHGNGETDWAPIMGAGRYANTVQWSKGEYTGATSGQDDLAIIAARIGYSVDDHTADTPLAVTGTDGFFGEGLIKRSTDEDSWTFQAGGSITVTVSTRPGRYGNLDAGFRLVNKATQATLSTVQPGGQRNATWTGDVNNAEYVVVVFSSGNGANASVGYTNYGSLGKYEVTVFPSTLAPLTCPYDNEDFRCPHPNKNNDPDFAYICYTNLNTGEQTNTCAPRSQLAWHGDTRDGYCGLCDDALTCPYDNEDFRCPGQNKKYDPDFAYICRTNPKTGEQENRCAPRTKLAWYGDARDGYCGECEGSKA